MSTFYKGHFILSKWIVHIFTVILNSHGHRSITATAAIARPSCQRPVSQQSWPEQYIKNPIFMKKKPTYETWSIPRAACWSLFLFYWYLMIVLCIYMLHRVFFKYKNVITSEKNRCHVTPLSPHNCPPLKTATFSSGPRVAAVERFWLYMTVSFRWWLIKHFTDFS